MSEKNIQSTSFTKTEIMIVKYIFKHYKDRFNARQLAKMLNINHANANSLCKLLTKKGLLIKEAIGNATYFSFDYANKLGLKFMEYLISQETNEIPKWLSVAAYALKKFNEQIQLGLIFGSSIKTINHNDIDVLLMYQKKKSRQIKSIKEAIRKTQLVEKPIRYIEITEEDIGKNKADKAFYGMIADSLLFHNPEKFVEVVTRCHN
jgi:predicted DNA-binding transcriptional regulator